MEETPPQSRATVVSAVEDLKKESAPTSIGYNDMAVMIAFGQSDEDGIPTVSADMIAIYLAKHVAVPEDARMQTEAVQGYLDFLTDRALLEQQTDAKKYLMKDDAGPCIVESYERLKSPKIGDLLFHGFRKYSSWEIDKERRAESSH